MQHFTVSFKPDGRKTTIHQGATILEAANQAGIVLNTPCGGCGTCGKCAVLLEPNGQKVLACQHKIDTDLTVSIPSASRFFEQKILEHGIKTETIVNPTIRKSFLKLESSDSAALLSALAQNGTPAKFLLSSKLKAKLDSDLLATGITVVSHLLPEDLANSDSECTYTIVAIEPGDTTNIVYGLAVDIGTTTVVAKLVDMTDGSLLATEATFNPQIRFGDDVVSRITYADNEENHLQLHKAVIDCINELIQKICDKTNSLPKNIYEMSIVGNTTMSHLFLKLPVSQLGQAPYKAFSLDAFDVTAAEFNLNINPAANVHTVENIAGFVGSDTTAVALATDIEFAKDVTLIIDIGTNGELVMGTHEKLYSASCAAGPALEGARIEFGSRAVEGAIEGVVINHDDIDIDTIGDTPSSSICGSGLIDAVAVMLDLGIIDSTGRFVEKESLTGLSDNVLRRVVQYKDSPAFVLAWQKGTNEPSVLLTQRDIRQLQLAKAAIRTGIKLLQKKLDVTDDQVQTVLMAGAFGNYIKRESALRIGLCPDVPPSRIHFVGNAASSGAMMTLLSRHARADARRLARKIEYVEIAHDPDFTMAYADCMMF